MSRNNNHWYINGQLVPNNQVIRRPYGYTPWETFNAVGNPSFQGRYTYPYAGYGGGYRNPATGLWPNYDYDPQHGFYRR
ncbi:hypothetical protein PRZ48_014164 [Zasmidium cellare]|uniref:Uncharacterized protein n=1 Tax=Zasmidium cellare TaxID=395010 RepID=A0ABR0E060_ZASCE|nr:hypothetical protein PRZ48_014164 [Zasmidium cellare]